MVALKRRKGYILKLARNPTLPDHDHSIFLKNIGENGRFHDVMEIICLFFAMCHSADCLLSSLRPPP